MTYRSNILAACKPYLPDDAAEVVAGYLNAFHAVDGIFVDKPSDEAKYGVVQLLIDLSSTIPMSPWMRQNGMMVMPVVFLAVSAHMDAAAYAKGVADPIVAGKVITARSLRYEIGQAVLLAAHGQAGMARSVEFRDALMKVAA